MGPVTQPSRQNLILVGGKKQENNLIIPLLNPSEATVHYQGPVCSLTFLGVREKLERRKPSISFFDRVMLRKERVWGISLEGKDVLSSSKKASPGWRLWNHRVDSGHWQTPDTRKECMARKIGSFTSDIWEIWAQRRLELHAERAEGGRVQHGSTVLSLQWLVSDAQVIRDCSIHRHLNALSWYMHTHENECKKSMC